MQKPLIQIKKKPHAPQLPEEIKTLQKLDQYIALIISNNDQLNFERIEKFLQGKSVFINQIATQFFKLIKKYENEKNMVRILFLIDFLCKNNIKESFPIAIKDYIKKIFIRVYRNQKTQQQDVTSVKLTFKSWFGIFSTSILAEISREIQKEFNEDLDALTKKQLQEVKQYYSMRQIQNYQDFLTGKYRFVEKKKKEEQQQSHSQSQQPQLQQLQQQIQQPQQHIIQSREPQKKMPPAIPTYEPQPIKKPKQPEMQFISNQLMPPSTITPLLTQNAQSWKFFPQPPAIPIPPPITPPTPPQQQQLLIRNVEFNNDTVFGPLFKYFSDLINSKTDLVSKDSAKEFLNKKNINPNEILFNPNKYSTLMKCPTCFMRFRNEKIYITHLTGHATKKLSKIRNQQNEDNTINCTIEQWHQSGYESEDTIVQKESYTSLDLEQLQNQECVFCLEKLKGHWDSVNCKWIYENVMNYQIQSNDLDEPSTLTMHQKCYRLLNQFNE